MARFDSAIAVATKLIEKNGEVSKFVRSTPVAGSAPWEPAKPKVKTTDVRAVWLNRSILRAEALAKAGEAYVLISGASLDVPPDPTTDAMIRADKARYAIMHSEVLDPNGQLVLYELRVKK